MDFNLFKTISSSAGVDACSVLFCAAALAAGVWSLASSRDEQDSLMFMLDGYNEQFRTHADNDDTLYFNFSGLGL
ncbi:hypothetical protein [uncultured Legionella sp.]|uniref:hypothetical protein n=1 Tax=uncultured Legionella sp. TaxID=210934 RepID=UPI00262AD77D|nr:hypothetical protein [uncultured Legionella sp.]